MKSRFLQLTLLVLFVVLGSCRKTNINPCDGLLNEGPPVEIAIKFIDQNSNDPLLINPADILVTETQTGKNNTNWRIYNPDPKSPLSGAFVLAIFTELGQNQYQIKVANKGTATLSYQVTKTPTNDSCRPFAYLISDIKIIDRAFEVFTYEGKTYPKILVVAL